MKKSHKQRRTERSKARSDSAGDDMHIYISPIMFIMAVCFTALGLAYEFFCSLAAVLLHECAHARVAKKLGYELNMIKLMPYGAALCGDALLPPKHEVRIALAGPLFNLTLATLFAALWWLVPQSYMFTQAFCANNLYIGLFNLLPVYPLDGGRVLLALLGAKIKRDKAYKITRIVSAVMGLIALSLFALSAVYSLNICFLCVGIFMLVSAFIPDNRAKYRALFALGSRVERLSDPLEVKNYAVSSDVPAPVLCRALDPERYTEFTVMDGTLEKAGRFDETDLINYIKTSGYDVTAGEIMDRHTIRKT